MPVVPAGRAVRPGLVGQLPLTPYAIPSPHRCRTSSHAAPGERGGGDLPAGEGGRPLELREPSCRNGPTSAPPAVKFDPAVVPAGGAGCCSVNHGDGQVRQAGFHHGHAHGCRDGMCVPSCPVRPGQFGYYGTQWRRWPGQGVIQASAAEGATPVAPPKSAVPGAEEESPAPRDGTANASSEADREDDAQAAPPRPADEPAAPAPRDDEAEAIPEPPRQQPAAARRDSAAITTAGPWSRMVATSSLPPGYEPPLLAEDPGQSDAQ